MGGYRARAMALVECSGQRPERIQRSYQGVEHNCPRVAASSEKGMELSCASALCRQTCHSLFHLIFMTTLHFRDKVSLGP